VAGPDGEAAVVAPEPAGVGVAGTVFVVEDVDWIGAAGGAGVEATAGAGVEGAFEEEAAEVAEAGGALGCLRSETAKV
jgi:hypothetical protein